MVDRLFVATKAFLTDKDGKVLILQESSEYEDGANPDSWDVPGGRVEKGENFEKSLKREIEEETSLNAEIDRPFHTDEWRPKVRGQKWQIVGTFFRCKKISGKVELSKDHKDFKWIEPEKFQDYSLLEADRRAFESFLKLQK